MVLGVRQYFDQGLRHFLLYPHEVQQADEALGGGGGGGAAATPPKQGGALCARQSACRQGRESRGRVGCSGCTATRDTCCRACQRLLPRPAAACWIHTVAAPCARAEGGGSTGGGATGAKGGGGGGGVAAPRTPCDLYGAEHLVRLFVKLPDLVPVAYMTPPVREPAAAVAVGARGGCVLARRGLSWLAGPCSASRGGQPWDVCGWLGPLPPRLRHPRLRPRRMWCGWSSSCTT